MDNGRHEDAGGRFLTDLRSTWSLTGNPYPRHIPPWGQYDWRSQVLQHGPEI